MRKPVAAIVVAVLVAAASVAPALGQAAPTPGAAPAGIPPLVWHLTEARLADGTSQAPADPSRYAVQFLPEGELTGTADCNTIRGSYTVDGDKLTIGPLASTRVGCPPASLGTEFIGWLEAATGFALAGDTLEITLADGGTLRLAASLFGVVWEWRSFAAGNDSVVTAAAAGAYTIEFQPDGTMLVQADCNRGRSQVHIDAPMIEVGAIGLTRRQCAAGSQDQQFLGYLTDAASFVIADGELVVALRMDGGFARFTPRPPASEATPGVGTPLAG